ncbi:MAG: 16S rRNA processing protein RimM [Candidatus Lambdaproteobacteria bacterium]|nr:16S rRNA processing protein RimM [Candidatus Lambdaproteobacteria bacterium]
MALIDRERLTCIGTVAQPHGIKGELRVTPLSSTPDFYAGLAEVVLDAGKGLRPMAVLGLRVAGGAWIVRLAGIDDRAAAEHLVGAELLVSDETLRPLAEDEYFQHDLIGCRVETIDGRWLGDVNGILETGANDVLDVSGGPQALLVPLLASVVQAVDIAGRCIRIAPLPGMLDEDD